MHRLVWGIVLIVLGTIGFFVPPRPDMNMDPKMNLVFSILSVSGGAVLVFFGSWYLINRSRVANAAFGMLRQRGEIDTGDIARQTGIGEMNVRRHILYAQSRGLIPMNAKIV